MSEKTYKFDEHGKMYEVVEVPGDICLACFGADKKNHDKAFALTATQTLEAARKLYVGLRTLGEAMTGQGLVQAGAGIDNAARHLRNIMAVIKETGRDIPSIIETLHEMTERLQKDCPCPDCRALRDEEEEEDAC